MADSARVLSIDDLRDFHDALVGFMEDARNALTDADFDLRRTVGWLENDQRLYWQAAIRQANLDLAEAKAVLHRKELGKVAGSNPDCYNEEKAVRKAKARLEEAEDKLKTVRAWIPELQHAMHDYLTRSQPLGDMLQGDLKQGLGKLYRMLDALDAYLRINPPSTPSPVPSGVGGTESVARPVETAAATVPTAGTPTATEKPSAEETQ